MHSSPRGPRPCRAKAHRPGAAVPLCAAGASASRELGALAWMETSWLAICVRESGDVRRHTQPESIAFGLQPENSPSWLASCCGRPTRRCQRWRWLVRLRPLGCVLPLLSRIISRVDELHSRPVSWRMFAMQLSVSVVQGCTLTYGYAASLGSRRPFTDRSGRFSSSETASV